MRKSNFLVIFILFIVIPAVSFSQRKKNDEEPVMPQPVYVEGVVYSLPRTGFKIKVTAEKTSFVPGPYAAYADKYLGIKNAQSTASAIWKISAIDVKPFTEPDPNAVFKAMDKVASQISVLSNGIIAGIRTDSHLMPNKIIGNDDIVLSKPLPQFTDLSSDEYYVTAVDPTTGTETTNYKTVEEKAREAADYIIRLRKKRAYTILNPSDVVPEDGEGYKVFVKEAKRLEKEYISLFVGKTVHSEHQFSFTFVPGNNEVKNEVLFRFSEDKGVVSKSDISGKPVMVSLSKDSDLAKTLNQMKKSENPQAGESGVFYRIPVTAGLTVTDGINTLYTGRANVPQFGAIAPVPEDLLDGSYSIKFDPVGGTILEVK